MEENARRKRTRRLSATTSSVTLTSPLVAAQPPLETGTQKRNQPDRRPLDSTGATTEEAPTSGGRVQGSVAEKSTHRGQQVDIASEAHEPPRQTDTVQSPEVFQQRDNPQHESMMPVETWGLDPLFYTSVRLLIRDVLTLPEFPAVEGSFCLHGHPIRYAFVAGFVTKCERKNKRLCLHIDDSTGILSATLWADNDEDPGAFFLNVQRSVRIGSFVNARGKLTRYRNPHTSAPAAVEMSCYHIQVLGDEHDKDLESMHILESLTLMETTYKKPAAVMHALMPPSRDEAPTSQSHDSYYASASPAISSLSQFATFTQLSQIAAEVFIGTETSLQRHQSTENTQSHSSDTSQSQSWNTLQFQGAFRLPAASSAHESVAYRRPMHITRPHASDETTFSSSLTSSALHASLRSSLRVAPQCRASPDVDHPEESSPTHHSSQSSLGSLESICSMGSLASIEPARSIGSFSSVDIRRPVGSASSAVGSIGSLSVPLLSATVDKQQEPQTETARGSRGLNDRSSFSPLERFILQTLRILRLERIRAEDLVEDPTLNALIPTKDRLTVLRDTFCELCAKGEVILLEENHEGVWFSLKHSE